MRSMTAFGRGCALCDGREITVEIKSVNNRFLDVSVRLPRAYAALEERVKAALSAAGVTRGKVDINITVADVRFKPTAGGPVPVVLEPDLNCAGMYVSAARALAEAYGLENDLSVARLLTLPGVMVQAQDDNAVWDDEVAWEALGPVVGQALDGFVSARAREGERLSADLIGKLDGLRPLTAELAARSQANVDTCRERFEERLRNILGTTGVTVDENRLLTECALYADRVAIDEELVRLASHFDTLAGLFASEEPVGRKIDFMLQETNREVNTIGSKCADADMARTVAQIKSELEKIREQIQNIE